jgi:hypothetical protein
MKAPGDGLEKGDDCYLAARGGELMIATLEAVTVFEN